MERWEEKEQREFLRQGTVAAAVYNVAAAFGGARKSYTAHDIFDIPRPKPDLRANLANAELMLRTINAAHQRKEAKKRRAS